MYQRSWLSMLLIMCMIVTSVGFIGGESAKAAGKSFHHPIHQSIYTNDPPIHETVTVSESTYLPKQTAHLLIYANDVDEAQGEWDIVYWNGENLGFLSGQNEQNSTSVFTLDLAKVLLANDLQIDVTNGLGSSNNWLLNAYWAQLVIDRGPMVEAQIASLQPTSPVAGTVNVAVVPQAIEPGDYYLEVNLIDDETGYNKGIHTQVFLGAAAGQQFPVTFDVTSLAPGKYTANAILYSYDDTQTAPEDKLGMVQHILSKTIDTRLVLEDVDFTPVGGNGQILFQPYPFDPYTTEYEAAVPYGTNAMTPATVLPGSLPAGAQLALQVNGLGYTDVVPGNTDDIPLQVGRNTIQYKVYTPDNPAGVVYTFTVDRAPKLENLQANAGDGIAPEFDGDTPTPSPGYRTTVANEQDAIALTPQLPSGADENTTISVKVNDGNFAEVDNGVVTDDLPLHVGRNTIIVRVTSPDGVISTEYPVYVDREPALAAPGLSEGEDELAPAFSSGVYDYFTTVGHTSTPIALTPVVQDGEKIEVRVNSSDEADYQAADSGMTTDDLDLIAGTNVIEVRVKSPDYDAELAGVPTEEKLDLVRTYTFTVIRNPFLTDIVVQDNDLKTAFDPDVLEHETKNTIPYSQAGVKVTAVTTDEPVKLEIRVNDGDYAPINSGELSDNLPLRNGKNKIEVKATSINPADQSEYSTVYTVYVNKNYPPSAYIPPASQLNAGKDGSGNSLLVTDVIGNELRLSGYLLDAGGKKLNRSSFPISAEGEYTLTNLPAGEYKMVFTVKSPDGQELAGHVAELEVDASGKHKADGRMIDPRSKVSDALTGDALEGVAITLYWADTERNRDNGRTPGAIVKLPVLNNFAPHKNSAAQITLADGEFGWVPFVEGDYYFVAEKEGYVAFDSREDSRSGSFGEGSSIGGGIISIGQSIVNYDFSMKPEGAALHEPYMKGYPDGEFKPDRGISRAELAVVLSRIIPEGKSVRDIPDLADLTPRFWASNAIDKALQQGWMKGYSDGTFKADRFVTRAEMAQAVYNIKAAELEESGDIGFTDIDGHWGRVAVKSIASQGWMTGDSNGQFRPNDYITRAEAVTLFNGLLGRNPEQTSQKPRWSDVGSDHWAYMDVMEASVAHEYNENENGLEVWAE
ncbi:cadherin-like beta sandwich domain-containing protein [Paenibacillus sp. J5C_2022]|nr:cadherin-like beta sandwich domain-containing protein [Paenibacillus sp. J5C2022]